MRKIIYLEGGGDSKELHTRCREGFRKLLENSGFHHRMPRLVACGGRGETYSDFVTAHRNSRPADFVSMLIDSEDPIANIENTWAHLLLRDRWPKPSNTDNNQVLLMVTCMESWIVSDRRALSNHYGSNLQAAALPPLVNLESRTRDDVQDRLKHATRNCSNAYAKGRRSFEILSKLDSAALKAFLPSFCRVVGILEEIL